MHMVKRSKINTSLLKLDETAQEFLDSFTDKELLDNGITKKQIEKVISFPFSYYKNELKKDNLYIYRLENFGTFYTTVKKMKSSLVDVKKKNKEGKVNDDRCQEIETMIESFLKRKVKE